jgi:hypothetical protein
MLDLALLARETTLLAGVQVVKLAYLEISHEARQVSAQEVFQHYQVGFDGHGLVQSADEICVAEVSQVFGHAVDRALGYRVLRHGAHGLNKPSEDREHTPVKCLEKRDIPVAS